MRIIQIISCLPAKRGRYFIILFPVCIQSVTDSTPCIKTPVNSPYLPLPIDNKGRSDIPRPCIIRCNFHIMDRIIFLIVFFFPDSFNYHLCMIQLPCFHQQIYRLGFRSGTYDIRKSLSCLFCTIYPGPRPFRPYKYCPFMRFILRRHMKSILARTAFL